MLKIMGVGFYVAFKMPYLSLFQTVTATWLNYLR